MTTHKAARELGPAIEDGKVRWLSATLLTAADVTQYAGCERRFWYRNVANRYEPFGGALEKGIEVHRQIEHYLTTGEKTFGDIALSGIHHIPEPHPSLLIEQSIADGSVTADNIPIAGHIDLVDPSGDFVEVVDWKTTGSARRIEESTPEALLNNLQMLVYAKWASLKYLTSPIRISHVYFLTRGVPYAKKVSTIVDRSYLEYKWDHIESVARRIRNIATSKTPDPVFPNENSCGAYGGCPHRSYCSVGQAHMFGGEKPMSKLSDLMAELERGEAEARGELPALLPPDAPESDPALASVPLEADDEQEEVTQVAKRKRGRPRKTEVVIPLAEGTQPGIVGMWRSNDGRDRALSVLLQIAENEDVGSTDRLFAAKAYLEAVAGDSK